MSEEFLNLLLPDVRDIISRDELNVQSEENVSLNDDGVGCDTTVALMLMFLPIRSFTKLEFHNNSF